MSLLLKDSIRSSFEEKMLNLLASDESGFFSSEGRINEPRVVAENVQEICKQKFTGCFTDGIISEDRSDKLTRRAMGDIYVIDSDNIEYYIDVKTHNLSTEFNMPNITSVDRLSRKYTPQCTNFFFLLLIVEYTLEENNITFTNVKLIPIENLAWDCLHIQALGKGQIQIKNANTIHIDTTLSRAQWMSTFYERMALYYTKAIQKIQKQQKIMQNRAYEWNDM